MANNNLNDSQFILEKMRKENAKNKTSNEKEKLVYMKNIFKADLAFIVKLSNHNIQVIFSDTSFILIDSSCTKQVIYRDKNKRLYNYNIHLVNKSSNKKFLKRYEYYKKIFYEKMEERLARKQQRQNICNNSNLENDDNNMIVNLDNEHNKTH